MNTHVNQIDIPLMFAIKKACVNYTCPTVPSSATNDNCFYVFFMVFDKTLGTSHIRMALDSFIDLLNDK